MKRVLRNALILAGIVGAVVAVRGYMTRDSKAAEGSVQITYDDGSMYGVDADSAVGGELVDIARKLLEVGV